MIEGRGMAKSMVEGHTVSESTSRVTYTSKSHSQLKSVLLVLQRVGGCFVGHQPAVHPAHSIIKVMEGGTHDAVTLIDWRDSNSGDWWWW